MGEALIDLVAARGETSGDLYRALAGGSGFNTALGLARLGVAASYCGALSRDAQGSRLSRDMRDAGIDLHGAVMSERPSPVVLVETDTAGSPIYSLHLSETALDDAPPAWAVAAGLTHLHATSFACTLGAGGAAALATLAAARGRTSTSFDPNIRPAILPDRLATLELLAERIALADIVKVSAEDLMFLTGDEAGEALIAAWLSQDVRLVVRTEGGRGATAFFGIHRVFAPAPFVEVSDTVGAGDSFMAALLAILAEEGRLGAGQLKIGEADAARWLAFATRAAAVTCTRAGADPPTRRELC